MKVHEAEAILKYYADIPQRIEIIRRQCEERRRRRDEALSGKV